MLRTRLLGGLVLLCVCGLAGCGDDSAGQSGGPGITEYDGGSEGGSDAEFPDAVSSDSSDAPQDVEEGGVVGCDFPPTGSDGSATITPSGPQPLLEKTGEAQNLADNWFRALPGDRTDVFARSSCGDLAAVLADIDPSHMQPDSLRYYDLTQGVGSPETITGEANGSDASLLFDDACEPVVIRGGLPGGYVAYERVQPGQWESTTITPDLTGVFGEQPTSFQHRWAQTTQDGNLHVIAEVTAGGLEQILHGVRTGSAWSFSVVSGVPDGDVSRYFIGPDGRLHATFTKTEYPCDPCNLDLYYALLDAGGVWVTTTVEGSKWGEPNDEFATTPSLVVGNDGTPWIAATFQVRAVTGSLITSDLRVYRINGGTACGESVAWTSAGYAGSDGVAFTGAQPDLRIDVEGRLHVVFSDIAQWHDGQGWANHYVGQVRHAVRVGTQWKLTTLYAQKGQTASPNPLIGFDAPILSVAPDGTAMHVLGTVQSWATDSLYNDQAMPLTLRAVLMRVDTTFP